MGMPTLSPTELAQTSVLVPEVKVPELRNSVPDCAVWLKTPFVEAGSAVPTGGAYNHVPVSALKREVTPLVPSVMRPLMVFAEVLVPPRRRGLLPEAAFRTDPIKERDPPLWFARRAPPPPELP